MVHTQILQHGWHRGLVSSVVQGKPYSQWTHLKCKLKSSSGFLRTHFAQNNWTLVKTEGIGVGLTTFSSERSAMLASMQAKKKRHFYRLKSLKTHKIPLTISANKNKVEWNKFCEGSLKLLLLLLLLLLTWSTKWVEITDVWDL